MEATKLMKYDKKNFIALKIVNYCNIDRVVKISECPGKREFGHCAF